MVPLCNYFEGMFSNQKSEFEDSSFYGAALLETTAHHEAAHAVVGYAMGETLASVGVYANLRQDGGQWTVGYGGEVRNGAPGRRRHVDYPYRPMHFRIGVVTAAGPAAERRYCIERELPLKLLLASQGDHDCISTIARCLEGRGRKRFAYQRLVWYAAQVLVSRQDIWSAICDVADLLYEEASVNEPEELSDGTVWTFIEPHEVATACRRHGIKRGHLRPS